MKDLDDSLVEGLSGAFEMDHILVLSTAHVTQQEAQWLENNIARMGEQCLSYEEGFIIRIRDKEHVQHLVQALEERKELLNVFILLLLAVKLGAGFLKLDADGPVVPGLPAFDW